MQDVFQRNRVVYFKPFVFIIYVRSNNDTITTKYIRIKFRLVRIYHMKLGRLFMIYIQIIHNLKLYRVQTNQNLEIFKFKISKKIKIIPKKIIYRISRIKYCTHSRIDNCFGRDLCPQKLWWHMQYFLMVSSHVPLHSSSSSLFHTYELFVCFCLTDSL